jgi:hypothetical protein
MMTLSAVPQRHAGQLYVSAADAATLLDVDASVEGKRLILSREASQGSDQQNFLVKQLPTPTPRPSPTQTPVPISRSSMRQPPQGSRLIGTTQIQFNSSVNDKSYNAMFDGGSTNAHLNLYASGVPGSRVGLGGTLRLGGVEKHVSFGGVTDPLYGNVFAFGGGNGFEVENARGATLSWSNSTFESRHVLAFGVRTTTSNIQAAFISQVNALSQLIAGYQRFSSGAHHVWDREFWIGEHGIAGGFHYRSDGRLYEEARFGFAGAGLPLTPGDAPTQLTAGYELSKDLGLRAGYGEGRGEHGALLGQIYGNIGIANLSLSRFGQQTTVAATFNSRTLQGGINVFRGPSYSGLNGDIAAELPRGFLSASAYAAGFGTTDVLLDYHLKRETPTMSLGVEDVRSQGAGRIGPTIGYSAPLGRALAVGLELHPLLHGNGLRFTVQHDLFSRIPVAAQRTITVASNGQAGSQLYVLIDGTRTRALEGSAVQVPVPAGTHYVSMQSADGSMGSPETRIIDGTPNTVTLPLWPVVHITGAVRLPASNNELQTMMPTSLAGISVVIEPGPIVAQTDETGAFDVPAQAIDPSATIAVDASTLPSGFAAPPAVRLTINHAVTIVLQPLKKVQKVVF